MSPESLPTIPRAKLEEVTTPTSPVSRFRSYFKHDVPSRAKPEQVATSPSPTSAGFMAGALPENESRSDYIAVDSMLGASTHVAVQQHPVPATASAAVLAAFYPLMQTTMIPTPDPNPTPAAAFSAAFSTRAVTPPPGTPQRVVILGPLRMIRSQCVANIDTLDAVLVWLDQYMGTELQTPACTDTMVSNVVYAVNIPMSDENWRDWNVILDLFPHASAWQKALTSNEPFDQVTTDHHTARLFVEDEPLEALLRDMVGQYNLGAQHELGRL
ncbi:hypothetical protein C7974DRAFT_454959 [Boeremia exigua]|uniref:uncharacterized protein n=1 Tax=Boeremia exigua TaxID=749465 RepID=UPI001E8E0260|nr:uncharacterized protein C7974DRAFT_476574 [Boeremia exigua]XP_045997645.1 uncharacterized protein C7974DRAFT_454959 [Boeremia exigua]KAH6612774.1 hypothetical protein C7974DRAFT_476574 [Boeremia exigua]KAH6629877.1 hypothetical protein C7974DRAFT_454959 [Boeremia exigua]